LKLHNYAHNIIQLRIDVGWDWEYVTKYMRTIFGNMQAVTCTLRESEGSMLHVGMSGDSRPFFGDDDHPFLAEAHRHGCH
jgi:hypothetical protein